MHDAPGHALDQLEQGVVAVAQFLQVDLDLLHGPLQQRFHQRGAVGEVAVQGGAANAGAFHYQVKRGGDAVFTEHGVGRVQ